MSSDNTVADRLVGDARRKTARNESPALGKIAMIVGIVALVVSPISIAGWVVGATAVGLGAAALRRTAPPKQAKIGLGLGVAAIMIGVFFYTLVIALG
ncbi:hypothetical protein [Pseudonocardia lacus]|uniref:hypothetical protein n=1 Tax=Pseudonocardia lacus TaxID=2835865 RepID=UPI001BDCA65C|nr:hypothetical protein [Pseudonocardia lacus]